jgi:signal transduction histidine kinase
MNGTYWRIGGDTTGPEEMCMNIPKDELIASIVSAKCELEQALETLEALPAFDPGTVGYAAHAINDYLAITSATLDLLEPALAGHPDAEVRNWLGDLRRGMGVMEHTVNQLISASAAGEFQHVFGIVNVVRLIQSGCDYHQTIAARKQIRINFASSVEAVYVRTDRLAVGAILDNLLSNAVKTSPPERRIWVIVAEGPDNIVCHVQDEGQGLSDEEKARLFHRGVRPGPRPTDGEASSGFGLAIAKELAEKLGGKIWCESAEGRGRRLSFSLPTRKA